MSIVAIGKQWAWDFQYNGDEEDGSDAVWTMGVQAVPDENGNVDQAELPTLVLPVDKSVQILLQSRDVIHSFWIIDFLYKKDMYIGRDNFWSFTPTREGTYAGKCAELCGEYHSAMLFNVEVVSEGEYEDYLDTLREDGQHRLDQRPVRPPAELARHRSASPKTPWRMTDHGDDSSAAGRRAPAPDDDACRVRRRCCSASRVEAKGNIVVGG